MVGRASCRQRPHRSRPARRIAVLVAAASPVVASACSVEDAVPLPACAGGGSTVLAAQSVPTADLVPCFDPLPDGWDVGSITIDQEGTVIRFDSDRAGRGAAVFHYVSDCDVTGAVDVPSQYVGAEQYELIEEVLPDFRGRRFHVFDGGCMWWEFDFRHGAESALSIELGDRLAVVTRDELNRSISAEFLDEEL